MSREEARARRIGLNEAVFRTVNEQLEALADQFSSADAALDLICECGDPDCEQRISVRRAEYERVRSAPELFLVVPGHEEPEVETVVEQGEGFHVIRKVGETPEAVARATDTRAR